MEARVSSPVGLETDAFKHLADPMHAPNLILNVGHVRAVGWPGLARHAGGLEGRPRSAEGRIEASQEQPHVGLEAQKVNLHLREHLSGWDALGEE